MEQATRKPNRLKEYDYSTDGLYFITICTKDKKPILSTVLAPSAANQLPKISLTAIGSIVNQSILALEAHYPAVFVANYVIMPNHIHLLLQMQENAERRPMAAPTISKIINQLKGIITKQCGTAIWQKGFYDHVIRSEKDYLTHLAYIDNNPVKWTDDTYYQPF